MVHKTLIKNKDVAKRCKNKVNQVSSHIENQKQRTQLSSPVICLPSKTCVGIVAGENIVVHQINDKIHGRELA